MIFIVIPSFNEKKFIRQILECLKVQTFQNYKIIISDNGSKDGTVEILANDNSIKLINNDSSYFWTKSTNAGIKYVIENLASQDDYILTLNCDSIIDENYLNSLLKFSKKNPNALVGSVNIEKSSNRVFFGGCKIDYLTAKYVRFNHKADFSKDLKLLQQSSHYLPGRGTLIPIKVFKRIGYFDESFPQYFADYEFSCRARKNSFPLIVNYDSPVYFFSGNTGLNNEVKKLSFIEFLTSFFNKKSPNNLYLRFRYNFRIIPIQYFFSYVLFDFIRVIFGSVVKQIRNI